MTALARTRAQPRDTPPRPEDPRPVLAPLIVLRMDNKDEMENKAKVRTFSPRYAEVSSTYSIQVKRLNEATMSEFLHY